jgi:L-fuculose-phosphate aldolase
MEKTESMHRNDIIDICKRVQANGWVAANDGNISIRISENTVLCTPTGQSKGCLSTDQLIKVDMDGNKKEGELEPSSEIKMHIDVYKNKESVKSVVHAHPPYATGFAVAGVALDQCIMPEIIIGLGSIPITKFGTPSTMEIPENIRPYLKEHDVFLLENHGALSAGSDVFQAYYRMESLELFAKISLVARLLGNVNVISEDNVKKLIKVRQDFGLPLTDYPGCKIDGNFIKEPAQRMTSAGSTQDMIREVSGSITSGKNVSGSTAGTQQGTAGMDREKITEIVTEVVNNVLQNMKKADN